MAGQDRSLSDDALHVTERYRRVDFGYLEIQSTIDDPKAYTKPWMVTEVMQLHPDDKLIELVCENEKDVDHVCGKYKSTYAHGR
jgi:hypothetical protein